MNAIITSSVFAVVLLLTVTAAQEGNVTSNGCSAGFCQNGGSCYNDHEGFALCDCSGSYHGRNCEYAPGECQYTSCENGGSCYREDGVEVCMCPEKYPGPFCDLSTAPCDEYECQNGGSCYNSTGIATCVCSAGYSGVRCDNIDEEKQCPVLDGSDMIFLPTCTLKSTLSQLSDCINYQLPFLMPHQSNAVEECGEKITRTKHCFYRTIQECSETGCDSAYLYGGTELYAHIALQFYDPTSNFSRALHGILCSLPDSNGSFPYPPTFNIGEPVCKSTLIDHLLRIMTDSTNNYPIDNLPQNLCPHLKNLKYALYNETKMSCDFTNLRDALTYLTNPQHMQQYWENLLEMSQEYFLEWIIPVCRGFNQSSPCDNYCMYGGYCTLNDDGPYCACPQYRGGARCEISDHVGVGDGDCPMVTLSSSQCQLADAWMCNYFNYGKAFSQWTSEFIDWLQGCDGFHERNWDDWASSAGFMRGDKYAGGQMPGWYGKSGFTRMIKANFHCPEMAHDDCNLGQRFTTTLGCTICYRPGSPRNTRNMLTLWMQEFQNHQFATEGYKKLREDCTRSSGGCDGETTPFPTFSTGFSTTFNPTGSNPPFSSTSFGSTFSTSSIPPTISTQASKSSTPPPASTSTPTSTIPPTISTQKSTSSTPPPTTTSTPTSTIPL